MNDLILERFENIALLTINRAEKGNAFNNELLSEMNNHIVAIQADPKIACFILKSNGKNFSAGADLHWMRSIAQLSEEENITDALELARLMFNLYRGPKPSIAMIQGAAFGGGAGLAAACSCAIASISAHFCFSEVKLGLIPAVISPYVIEAIGARNAQMLFMSAEVFNAERAQALGLVQDCVPEDKLYEYTLNYAQKIAKNAPEAVRESLNLVHEVKNRKIDESLINYTAALIAKKRVSSEGQRGLKAFLNKEKIIW